VVDPYRTPLSKSDIDQLRFEVDQDIPPYAPPPPPVLDSSDEEEDEEEETIFPISMDFDADYDWAHDGVENTYTISCVIVGSVQPELFERLAPYFMERRDSSMASQHTSMVSSSPLSHQQYDTSQANIIHKTFRLTQAMRRMDEVMDSDELFQTSQFNVKWSLHRLAGTLMRQLLENGGYLAPATTMYSRFIMLNGYLTMRWRVSNLRNAFFETLHSEFREIPSNEDPEFPGQDLFRSILQTFKGLLEEIVLHARFQMSATPRSLLFEDDSPDTGQQFRALTFDVVPRPPARES
jgi:hypothetical protein